MYKDNNNKNKKKRDVLPNKRDGSHTSVVDVVSKVDDRSDPESRSKVPGLQIGTR